MSDNTDSASEEYAAEQLEHSSSAYLSEHESDQEFIEQDSQPCDGDFVPESEEPSSEDSDENFGHVSVN
jgi:hypothetical protein